MIVTNSAQISILLQYDIYRQSDNSKVFCFAFFFLQTNAEVLLLVTATYSIHSLDTLGYFLFYLETLILGFYISSTNQIDSFEERFLEKIKVNFILFP